MNVGMENKPGGWRSAEEQQTKKEETKKLRIKKKEAKETFWGAPLTYEVVRFPDVVVPHCDFQGLFRQVAMLYLVAKLLLGSGDSVRTNPCQVRCRTPAKGLGLSLLLLGLFPSATPEELNLDPSPHD